MTIETRILNSLAMMAEEAVGPLHKYETIPMEEWTRGVSQDEARDTLLEYDQDSIASFWKFRLLF